MTSLYHPDVYWIRRALLMAILSHPYVKDTEVSYPNIGGRAQPAVGIKRARLFGGPELIEPGLTLAVYPFHSTYDPIKGAPSTSFDKQSIYYPPNSKEGYSTIRGVTGRKAQATHACMKFVVQLYLKDATFNASTTLRADYQSGTVDRTNDYFGYDFQYEDDAVQGAERLQDRKDFLVNSTSVEVQILPGEEILTQWMDIIKYAIRDITVLYPFPSIRNPHILATDYPTSTWLSKPANLIFHTATHVVQYDVAEPALEPLIDNPGIQDINISA